MLQNIIKTYTYSTKLDGNDPTTLFLFKRPTHQLPSPILSTSIKSPSTNPRSSMAK